MTALFNLPSFTLGAVIASLIVVFVCDNVAVKPRDAIILEHNQVIADCEANLPRNQSCELTAKVKK